ncbi:hypothetical protein [Pigmentibacter ruber]|uniref:hypothetical protein n=1 Tax=Pigmentibacter ruber TaxID=2683196 RepID=UPI00131A9CA8|nr:hypothetical protein [Pigmentibacter ruber]
MQIIKKGFATLLAVTVTSTAIANTQETCTADVNFLKNQVKLLDTSVKNLTGFMVSGKDKAQLATINELKIKVEALSQNYQNLLSKVQNHPSNDADYITVGTKRIPNPCNSFGVYKVSKEVTYLDINDIYCTIKIESKDSETSDRNCKIVDKFHSNFILSLEHSDNPYPKIHPCNNYPQTSVEKKSVSYSRIRTFLLKPRD